MNQLQRPGVNLQYIADKSGVHKSQVSRFRRGLFSRLSKNLLKVCHVLQIESQNATTDDALTMAVHGAWDGTIEGKEMLLALLKALKDWRTMRSHSGAIGPTSLARQR